MPAPHGRHYQGAPHTRPAGALSRVQVTYTDSQPKLWWIGGVRLPGKWIAVPKPSAELEQEQPEPETRDDNAKIYYFRTRYGVRFAQVVETSGFVLWLQEVP